MVSNNASLITFFLISGMKRGPIHALVNNPQRSMRVRHTSSLFQMRESAMNWLSLAAMPPPPDAIKYLLVETSRRELETYLDLSAE